MSGGLVAAAFAVKYPLIGVPNVEPLTLAFFCVGYAFGPAWGVFVGLVGETIYATFNPYGAPIPPVWAAQIAGMAVVGLIGGLTRRMGRRLPSEHRLTRLVDTAAGITATLAFDVLTNLAMAWSIGPFWAVLVAAAPFAAVHVASNALLFLLIFPILRRWLVRPPNAVVEPSSV